MTGVAVPLGRLQFIDPLTDGPVAFGTVEHYVPFSSTPKVTWADQGQATANVNPLPLDAAGQPSMGGIWGDGLYRQILKRADGSVIWDLVTGFLSGGGGGGGGDVFGPGASVPGNFAVWSNAIGTLLGDGGTPGALAFLSTATIGTGGTGATTAANARINLGLVIGTNVQAYNANLQAIAGLTSAADKLAYFTGAGTAATTYFTSFARSVLDDADGPAMLVTIGAEPRGQVVGINTQTASYSLVLADAGQIVEMNVAGANNLTVPLNATQAFPIKTRIDLVQIGVGQTTVVATGGVTIRSKGGALKLSAAYSGATLYKRGTDEWVLIGDITT